ncbi:MAG: PepSY-associated TM helix domain-containing protein [Steroidobacteraceae bacterium]
MQNTIFRIFRSVHAWGGVTLALLMLLISVTGALLVWKQEYLRLTIPEARAAFTPTPEALARLAGAVEAQFNRDEIFLIEFATAEFPLTKVTLSDTRYAYLDTQGKVIDQWVMNERWEEWLYDLHHRLLWGNRGLTIVGCAAMAMIILLIAGLVAFWPMRRGFAQGVWPKSTARPQLLRAHRNIGLIEALPLLLSLVTGVILAFPQQAQRLLLEPFRTDEYSMDFAEHLDGIAGGNSGEWLPAMQRALRTFPGSAIRSAEVPNSFSPYRIIGVQQPGELHPQGLNKVYIDAQDGHMDIRIDAQAQHVSERLFNAGYPLHTGRFDNLFYKILLTLSGLLVATLSTMGLVSFVKGRW